VTPKMEDPERTPRMPQLNVDPPSPATERPFRDIPDDEDDRPDGGGGRVVGDDDRSPHEMLSEQQLFMDGK